MVDAEVFCQVNPTYAQLKVEKSSVPTIDLKEIATINFYLET